MNVGDRVSISNYCGNSIGTVLSVSPGYITVTMDGTRKIVDPSRRTVKVVR